MIITKFQITDLENLVRKVCDDWYLKIDIENIQITENVKQKTTNILYTLKTTGRKNKEKIINHTGCGVANTFFESLINQFSEKHKSLNNFSFKEFNLVLLKNTNSCLTKINNPVETNITIINDAGDEFQLKKVSHSFNLGIILSIKELVELFINADTAVIRLMSAVKDSEKRHRGELTEKFKNQLFEISKITNYNKTINNE